MTAGDMPCGGLLPLRTRQAMSDVVHIYDSNFGAVRMVGLSPEQCRRLMTPPQTAPPICPHCGAEDWAGVKTGPRKPEPEEVTLRETLEMAWKAGRNLDGSTWRIGAGGGWSRES